LQLVALKCLGRCASRLPETDVCGTPGTIIAHSLNKNDLQVGFQGGFWNGYAPRCFEPNDRPVPCLGMSGRPVACSAVAVVFHSGFPFRFPLALRFFAAALEALVAIALRCSAVKALAIARPPLRPISAAVIAPGHYWCSFRHGAPPARHQEWPRAGFWKGPERFCTPSRSPTLALWRWRARRRRIREVRGLGRR
jgi:hypothetical protein